jgi:hypothetical protein
MTNLVNPNHHVWLLLLIAFVCAQQASAQSGVCPIKSTPLDSSEWVVQARCLLRNLKKGRVLGPALTSLPAPLDSLVGRANVIDKAILSSYLRAQEINPAIIGGPIEKAIVKARYFIIHDTSSPNLKRLEFPSNDVLNGRAWNKGRLNAQKGKQTHVWVDRVGASATSKDYAIRTAKSGVKLEVRYPALKGLLLHTELIQPRRCDPERRQCCHQNSKGDEVCNDAIAPQPGYSEAQLDRLALLYVAASTRRGRWLIPAFHGVVDDEFGDRAHDDPQHFDLRMWANRLQVLLHQLAH